MSPRKSGVKSSAESYDKKNEKVLEFPESARIAKKNFSLKSPPPLTIIHSSLSEPKANSEERKPLMSNNCVHYSSPKGACAIGRQRACALYVQPKCCSPIYKGPMQG